MKRKFDQKNSVIRNKFKPRSRTAKRGPHCPKVGPAGALLARLHSHFGHGQVLVIYNIIAYISSLNCHRNRKSLY